MIKFLFKGLIRDKSRSLLPVLVVTIGVMITVFLQAYMNGVMGDSIESTARFQTGHVKLMTAAYHRNLSQMPNDAAITDVSKLMKSLRKEYPDMQWTDRIMFGGMLDAPDSAGITRSQGNVAGTGIHLLGTQDEIDRMDLKNKLFSGRFPVNSGEIMITNELFHKMNLQLGDRVTLISSTMYGDMALYNFTICGTLHFGISAIDKGMVYADIEDVRSALNMEDAAGEVLGFFGDDAFDSHKAKTLADNFNAANFKNDDPFSIEMLPMNELNGMDFLISYSENAQFIIIFIFVFAMSVVLWNAGLVGGLRRYGEFGLRLAIGENKHEIYRSLVGEAILIGLMGSVLGVSLGLLFSYWMQIHGIDTSGMMKNSNMMFPAVFRSRIDATTYYIGFIPGLLSTVIGAMLAGIGVYKRQTANLFKELI